LNERKGEAGKKEKRRAARNQGRYEARRNKDESRENEFVATTSR
jgi:hypothetical protein